LPRPVIKSHPEEKVGIAPCYGNFPTFEVPFNIYVMAEASDFKYGIELGFAKSNYKISQQKTKKRTWSSFESSKKCGVPL